MFLKIENIPDLLSDDQKVINNRLIYDDEGKIIEYKFEYFSNRTSFMGNPVEHTLGRRGPRWRST